MPPTISVALCTHNGAEFIDEQVASILAQTQRVDELVLSDDASTDDTVDRVERLVTSAAQSGRAPRLVVLRNEQPLGVTANFAQAIAATTGDRIALSDQDDRWRPDRIQLEAEAMSSGALLVYSDARLVDRDGAPLGGTLFGRLGLRRRERRLLASGRAVEALLARNLVTGATVLIDRSLYDRAAPLPASWVHDEWLAMTAALLGGLVKIDAPLIDYRQHGGNQIGVADRGLIAMSRRALTPLSSRTDALVARADDLAARWAEDLELDENIRGLLAGKRDHERFRAALSRERSGRIGPVLSTLVHGAYGRFGRGPLDAARDIVRPA